MWKQDLRPPVNPPEKSNILPISKIENKRQKQKPKQINYVSFIQYERRNQDPTFGGFFCLSITLGIRGGMTLSTEGLSPGFQWQTYFALSSF